MSFNFSLLFCPNLSLAFEGALQGCGNGYSGTGSTWPCISDNVCSGSTKNGHGRGMCQWGSSRWATQGQVYTWILDHYYNPGNYYRCGSSCALTSITPTIVSPGTSTGPGPIISTLTPTLTWNAVPGATNYGVYVRDILSDILVVDNNCATATASYEVPSGILSNNRQYRWNIRANVSCGSCVSLFSSRLFFQTPTLGTLSVTPSDGLSSSGNQGGPFSPSSKTYTLSNTGGSSINWTGTKAQAWVTLSSTSGTLAAGASTTVTVSINSNANSLSPSSYSDNVNLTNTTNGNGNTTRAVSLTVNPIAGTLAVTPSDGFSSSGNQGGPFSPSSKTYTLSNTGGSSINWTGTKSQAWVTLSSTSGTLAAGASTTVTVSINSNANSLSPGSYSDNLNFTNTTNGNGTTTRPVSLTVNPIQTFTISGFVRTSTGAGISGVVMNGLPGNPTPTTFANGDYMGTVNYGWTGTVTPILNNYTFIPPSTQYNAISFNQTTNYTSTPIVGIDNYSSIIPEQYALYQNFPNPFNPSTVIRYDIPSEGMVSIKVYDLFGGEVKVLINGYKNAGSYFIELNASEIPSGVYFYTLKTNDYTLTKKLLLLK